MSDNNSNVEVTIRSARFRLVVTASGNRDEAVLLHGPTPGGEFRPFVHGKSVRVPANPHHHQHFVANTSVEASSSALPAPPAPSASSAPSAPLPCPTEMLDASVAVELTRISNGAVVFAGEGSLGGLEIESMERGGQALLERGAG